MDSGRSPRIDGDARRALPRVVLADDHPALLSGIRLHLERAGLATVVGKITNGAETLPQIRALRPDIALVDVRMQGMDGLELVRTVATEQSFTRVILLSALSEAHLVQRALTAGAFGYVSKEAPVDVLCAAVASVAAGSRFVDPTLLAGVLGPDGELLTEREREVLQLVADGMQNKGIALRLGVSEETVKTHLSNVMRKLGAASRTEAVASALRRAIIE